MHLPALPQIISISLYFYLGPLLLLYLQSGPCKKKKTVSEVSCRAVLPAHPAGAHTASPTIPASVRGALKGRPPTDSGPTDSGPTAAGAPQLLLLLNGVRQALTHASPDSLGLQGAPLETALTIANLPHVLAVLDTVDHLQKDFFLLLNSSSCVSQSFHPV